MSETYTIEDIFYSKSQTIQNNDWVLDGHPFISWDSTTGLTVSSDEGDNQGIYKFKYDLPTQCTIECTITGYGRTYTASGGFVFGDICVEYGTNRVISYLVGNNARYDNMAINVGDKAKFVIDGLNVSIYHNNTFLTTYTSRTDRKFGIRAPIGRSISIKDLTIS